MADNTCVCCGTVIPEGRMVCPTCEARASAPKYDPDEFFKAERYPLPMKCPECGKTMRPVHKHRLPDMPRYYFCTFCDAMIPENHPGIRFRKKPTNADRIRAMSDEELAEVIVDGCCRGNCDCPDEFTMEDGLDCYGCWLDWLRREATE